MATAGELLHYTRVSVGGAILLGIDYRVIPRYLEGFSSYPAMLWVILSYEICARVVASTRVNMIPLCVKLGGGDDGTPSDWAGTVWL